MHSEILEGATVSRRIWQQSADLYQDLIMMQGHCNRPRAPPALHRKHSASVLDLCYKRPSRVHVRLPLVAHVRHCLSRRPNVHCAYQVQRLNDAANSVAQGGATMESLSRLTEEL